MRSTHVPRPGHLLLLVLLAVTLTAGAAPSFAAAAGKNLDRFESVSLGAALSGDANRDVFASSKRATALALADFDRDGRLDLATVVATEKGASGVVVPAGEERARSPGHRRSKAGRTWRSRETSTPTVDWIWFSRSAVTRRSGF